MDKPLTKWYCDVCGEVIEDIKYGYLIWKTTEECMPYNFKLIHQNKCDIEEYPLSTALENIVGEQGVAYLLSFLSPGSIKKQLGYPGYKVRDVDEFVDLFRRLQTPFYEEARRYFNNPDLLERLSDANEVSPYMPEQLKNIVEKYSV